MGIYARMRGVPFVLPRNLFLCSRRLPSRSVISAAGHCSCSRPRGPFSVGRTFRRNAIGKRSRPGGDRLGPENGQGPRGSSLSHPRKTLLFHYWTSWRQWLGAASLASPRHLQKKI
ncbi:hypothetical protein CEXT_99151 [Caerostris extrusa]|uniref:Uncharacterized protein n=1 Tax=Caerostris extrusa TaxID=172846 RepID=A0AAV4NX70_CAEEX|nr:hypothetical protein CEXT_99151 [Caerostris extrusa]